MLFAQRCTNDEDLDNEQKSKTNPQKSRIIDLKLEERFNVVSQDTEPHSHCQLH
jgi:hypothetical protein